MAVADAVAAALAVDERFGATAGRPRWRGRPSLSQQSRAMLEMLTWDLSLQPHARLPPISCRIPRAPSKPVGAALPPPTPCYSS